MRILYGNITIKKIKIMKNDLEQLIKDADDAGYKVQSEVEMFSCVGCCFERDGHNWNCEEIRPRILRGCSDHNVIFVKKEK
jgi:hypothetical protein